MLLQRAAARGAAMSPPTGTDRVAATAAERGAARVEELRSDASTALAQEKLATKLRAQFEQQYGRRAQHMTLWDTLELFGIQVRPRPLGSCFYFLGSSISIGLP
jgi:hypothetical protein